MSKGARQLREAVERRLRVHEQIVRSLWREEEARSTIAAERKLRERLLDEAHLAEDQVRYHTQQARVPKVAR